jgi:tetratricopeptide (TPR) repeat protein
MTMDDEAATRASEASLELFRAIGDDASAAGLMHRLSLGALYSGDTRRARGLAEETSEAMARAGGGPRNEAKKLRMFAQIEAAEGNHQRALELSVQAARIAKEIGWTWWEEGLLLEAAQAALRMGRGEEAESWGREGLRLAHRLDDGQGLVYGLALLAWAAAARRDAVRAGRLWGAVESIEASGRSLGGWPGERAEFAGEIEMPDSDFEPGRQDGRRTPLAAALQFALGAQPQSAPAP